MQTFVVLICILAVALAHSEWETFKLQYGRKYSDPTEEAYRKQIFLDNKMTIEKHNQRFYEGKTTFIMGINQFADMTNEEYNNRLKTNITMVKYAPSSLVREFSIQSNPESIDWRDTGCITGVKDQGQCGSTYAFAATEVTEYVTCQATGKLVSCSEQNVMDCSMAYGNLCCDGGTLAAGLQYIIDYGIDSEAQYPYTVSCHPKNCPSHSFGQCSLNNFYDVVPYGSEDALETAVATIGPVIALVDASHASFQLYTAGIYQEPLCSSTQLDQYVMVVGYGVDGDQPYWLIKNSWGTSWGLQGYMELIKGKDNHCGVATQATYGT